MKTRERQPLSHDSTMTETLKTTVEAQKTTTFDAPFPSAYRGYADDDPDTVPWQKATERFDMASYSGTVLREVWTDVADNLASNLAQREIRLVNRFHRYDADTYGQFRFAIMGRNGIDADMVEEAADRLYTHLFEVADDFGMAAGFPHENPGVKFEGDSLLKAISRYVAEKKLVWEVFRGAWAEVYTARTLAETFRTPVLLGADDVAEATGADDPEARGYDAYLPEEDLTVQIKEGRGGTTSDESDVVARYVTQNRDGGWLGEPYVEVQKND